MRDDARPARLGLLDLHRDTAGLETMGRRLIEIGQLFHSAVHAAKRCSKKLAEQLIADERTGSRNLVN